MKTIHRIIPLHTIPANCRVLALGLFLLIASGRLALAVTVTSEEMSQSQHWVSANIEAVTEGKAPAIPFSFIYDGQPAAEWLENCKFERTTQKLDDQRTQHTLSWTDPKTGLNLRCVVVEYNDFPTVEWTLYFKNTGEADTPILEKVQALDMRLERGEKGEFILYHNVGSPCAPNDYAPLETTLGPKAAKRISAAGGRPTNSDLSYFNVGWSGQGVIVVVGWPGQWTSEFARDDGKGLHITAGQELTHFKLLPGEQVRTPLMVLQFWTGDHIRAQNIWRRWMLAHNVPRPGGKLPEPELFGCSAHYTGEMTLGTEENQIQWIDRYLEEKVKIGHYWMDAGWYVNKGGWPNTGTWEVDLKRFPHGLRAICDHAHANGIKTIVWFEPERVTAGTWLTENHPEWILGGKNGGLLNLGNTEARQWLTDHIDKLLTDQGIDLYREDFNMDPLGYWRANDAPDRQGITEIHDVEGHLAYWDELLRRHPDMFIDSCASGGRRNDLESMRRAIPLWRTDYRCEPVGTECHTYGISSWIPLSGTGAADVDSFIFRSNMVPFTNCLWDMRNRQLDYDLMRRLTGEFAMIAHYWLGDYYPLTRYTTDRDAWMAWQFDVPEKGEGMVQAFRRPESPFYGLQLKLQGLEPVGVYALTDLDVHHKPVQYTGRQLMDQGLPVNIPDQPGAVVITYKKLN
ncbi:MAG: alpha-galactosidase [Candidatus Omnitrophica bacterium]|nr:alpha-galactosidase [Candidatus Omnitrophota bacterium]